MFRNSESHFANVPDIKIQRSKMRIPHEHKTSFNVGEVIPIYFDPDILPGDTVKMTHSAVVRLQTLLAPIYDNLILDFYWFFEPYRLTLDHWKRVMQENETGPWAPEQEYSIPTIGSPEGGFAVGTLADYLGYPVGVEWEATDRNAPSALPFRGIAHIMSEFFRDENVTYPLNITKNDSNVQGSNGSNYITDIEKGGKPFIAAKTHDYWTSMLPSAQKAADPVTFPLINGLDAPIYASKVKSAYGNLRDDIDSTVLDGIEFVNFDTSGTAPTSGPHSTFLSYGDPGISHLYGSNDTISLPANRARLLPSNLWADLSSSVGAVTVNELRLAFQLQKWYERAAMGSRYTELIRNMFGVQSPDARLQRPEYLGGNRVPIVINEVTNTSADSGSDSVPLGHLGANSNTSDVNTDFVHSFTEHGMLFGFAVVRIANHTYTQGFEKGLLRKTWTDFYWPTFAHLGEQSTPKCLIYADGLMDSDEVFGYQECWAEYRYRPNRCSGELRPNVQNGLASWTLADLYSEKPTLSDAWIREDKTLVDRALAVTSSVANQVFADFYFEAEYTRPMPIYSVPGLIDHF